MNKRAKMVTAVAVIAAIAFLEWRYAQARADNEPDTPDTSPGFISAHQSIEGIPDMFGWGGLDLYPGSASPVAPSTGGLFWTETGVTADGTVKTVTRGGRPIASDYVASAASEPIATVPVNSAPQPGAYPWADAWLALGNAPTAAMKKLGFQ